MKKRPWPVWVIAIFVLYGVASYFVTLLAAYTGHAPGPLAAAVKSVSLASQLIGAGQMLLYGSAALFLWLLNRQAAPVFLISLAVAVIGICINYFTQPAFAEIARKTLFIPQIVGLALKSAMTFYSYRLKRIGLLS